MQKEITMTKEFIVAIELGSSKIVGVAGKKNMDGSISVLASVRENTSSFIRKGVVYNIDKTAQCITNVVNKLSATLKTEIARVYVGVGGQSIHSVRNTVMRDLPANSTVTQEMVDQLMEDNRHMSYDGQVILDAATQEYKVDSQEETDPVGIQCSRLQGVFLNILCREIFFSKLNKCFEQAGVSTLDMHLAPLALADAVLTDAEKRSGCVLVDLGADTTTVSVYHRNILRHLAVIPLGGNNITKDIASLQMEESQAEKMKIEYGRAYTPNADIDDSLKLPIDDDRTVSSRRFIEIVEGRVFEIIENINHQVEEYKERMLGGIILTGGGSNMRDIERAFREHMGIDKVRRAGFVTHSITARDTYITDRNGMMNTVLALLAKGNTNCAGQPISANGSLPFDDNKPASADNKDPRSPSKLKPGEVQSEAERQQYQAKLQQEEAERLAEQQRRQQEEKEEEKSRGLRGMFRSIGDRLKRALTEVDE